MFRGSIAVAGGGVAGLATALLLAREGHRVTLSERDAARGPEIAPEQRRGIPHYLQPHAMIPRARVELREALPDVYDDLIARGAWDVDLRSKIPGPLLEEDELLQYVAVRRPLFETALRAAVHAEPRIMLRNGERLRSAPGADLVVDAMGRRSFLAEKTQTSDCGVVYYCRYFRQLPGFELPDGPWILSPRGDLGYFGYASFQGDNATFGIVLAVPPGDEDWKLLHEVGPWMAAAGAIPQVTAWVDPRGTEPITGVLAMAGLRNAAPPHSLPPGRVAVGDAIGHTDPVLAHGLAFSLIHARALRDVLREYHDPGDVSSAYLASVRPLLQERYELLTDLDAQRLNRWRGEPVDFARDYALFTYAAGQAVSLHDPDVFRAHMRRIGLLESTSVMDGDLELRESMAKQLSILTPAPLGPSRDEMVALLRKAAHD